MFTASGQPDLSFACVVRGGGKGGGSSPQYIPPVNPPTYTDPVSGQTFYSPDDLNTEIAQRTAAAATTSAANTATANQSAADAQAAWQQQNRQAYGVAMRQAVQNLRSQGINPDAPDPSGPGTYRTDYIIPQLQYQKGQNQYIDPTTAAAAGVVPPAPQAAYPTNLGASISNDILSGQRTQATNQLNSLFTPTYASDQLPSSFMDPFVTQAVNAQFDPLSAQLVNAQQRGTLTGPGYQAALDALNTAKTGATSTVQSLGSNILNTDRSSLNDLITGARTDASNLSLAAAQNYDPSAYGKQAQTQIGTDESTFGGALQDAIGNTKFSDITSLINAGGAVQGAQTAAAAGPLPGTATSAATGGAIPLNQQLQNQPRGLGNVGAF